MVQQGAMYQLSKASLKMIDAGKRKWNTTGHDCEAYLENSSLVRALLSPAAASVSPSTRTSQNRRSSAATVARNLCLYTACLCCCCVLPCIDRAALALAVVFVQLDEVHGGGGERRAAARRARAHSDLIVKATWCVMQLEEIPEEAATAAIPRIALSPVPIASIGEQEAGSMVDIVGVVESCDDITSINRRDGTEVKKRTLVLRDASNASIEVTLWGDRAEDPGAQLFEARREGQHPVLVLKSAPPTDPPAHTCVACHILSCSPLLIALGECAICVQLRRSATSTARRSPLFLPQSPSSTRQTSRRWPTCARGTSRAARRRRRRR
jgi:Replication protein A OB domain